MRFEGELEAEKWTAAALGGDEHEGRLQSVLADHGVCRALHSLLAQNPSEQHGGELESQLEPISVQHLQLFGMRVWPSGHGSAHPPGQGSSPIRQRQTPPVQTLLLHCAETAQDAPSARPWQT